MLEESDWLSSSPEGGRGSKAKGSYSIDMTTGEYSYMVKLRKDLEAKPGTDPDLIWIDSGLELD